MTTANQTGRISLDHALVLVSKRSFDMNCDAARHEILVIVEEKVSRICPYRVFFGPNLRKNPRKHLTSRQISGETMLWTVVPSSVTCPKFSCKFASISLRPRRRSS